MTGRVKVSTDAASALDALALAEQRLAQDELDWEAQTENTSRSASGRRPLLRRDDGTWLAPADDPWVRDTSRSTRESRRIEQRQWRREEWT